MDAKVSGSAKETTQHRANEISTIRAMAPCPQGPYSEAIAANVYCPGVCLRHTKIKNKTAKGAPVPTTATPPPRGRTRTHTRNRPQALVNQTILNILHTHSARGSGQRV